MNDDMAKLLREFAAGQSRARFRDARRPPYPSRPFSLALRQVGDPHLAEGNHASSFLSSWASESRINRSASKPCLSGWLYRTAQYRDLPTH